MEIKMKFECSGVVMGNLWGGGMGYYPSIKFKRDTLDELMVHANECLLNGTLDSGMGYESLIGAILEIKTIKTINFEGKDFINTENHIEIIGNLSDKDKKIIINNLDNIIGY